MPFKEFTFALLFLFLGQIKTQIFVIEAFAICKLINLTWEINSKWPLSWHHNFILLNLYIYSFNCTYSTKYFILSKSFLLFLPASPTVSQYQMFSCHQPMINIWTRHHVCWYTWHVCLFWSQHPDCHWDNCWHHYQSFQQHKDHQKQGPLCFRCWCMNFYAWICFLFCHVEAAGNHCFHFHHFYSFLSQFIIHHLSTDVHRNDDIKLLDDKWNMMENKLLFLII